ncbi:uncharacterized protein LOC135845167 [Planococcus citri]|uniref:uncharacterized protein LOC135845167 n=1 Tax=Planococcus citri TaxID=170843 RepID=UPI0031F94D0E
MKTYPLLLATLLVVFDLSECFEVPNWHPVFSGLFRIGLVESQIWPKYKYIFPYRLQSPVDITLAKAQERDLPPLAIHFPWNSSEEMVSIENTGYYLEVLLPHEVEERPFISGGPLYNARYIFEQLHFHWSEDLYCGSEHLLAGRCYSTEVHVVYYYEIYGSFEEACNHPDGVAVLTFFGDLSADDSDNPDLKYLIQEFSKVTEPESKTSGSFNKEFRFLDVIFKQKTYFSFPGSLTTDPYSECVTWIICPEPFDISSRQLEAFRTLKAKDGHNLNHNDRERQKFSNRPVITPSNVKKFKFFQEISFSSGVWFTQSRIWPYAKYIFPYRIQSPINISIEKVQYRILAPLEIHFPSNSSEGMLSIENTGDKFSVEMSPSRVAVQDGPYLTGGPLLDGRYLFQQMHFHWAENNSCGSEHLISGKCFSIEAHLVYYHEIYGSFQEAINHADGLAVAAFFGKLTLGDSDNPELKKLVEKLSMIIEPVKKTEGSFDNEFKFLRNIFKRHSYYSYPGSLTTPPYSECVTWFIYPEPFAISSAQLESFRKLRGKTTQNLEPTIRALQDFSGRPMITPSE